MHLMQQLVIIILSSLAVQLRSAFSTVTLRLARSLAYGLLTATMGGVMNKSTVQQK